MHWHMPPRRWCTQLLKTNGDANLLKRDTLSLQGCHVLFLWTWLLSSRPSFYPVFTNITFGFYSLFEGNFVLFAKMDYYFPPFTLSMINRTNVTREYPFVVKSTTTNHSITDTQSHHKTALNALSRLLLFRKTKYHAHDDSIAEERIGHLTSNRTRTTAMLTNRLHHE